MYRLLKTFSKFCVVLPLVIGLLMLSEQDASAAPPIEEYVLVPELSDEFNASELDSDKWLYRKDTRFFGNNLPQNVSVTNDPIDPAVQALRLEFGIADDPDENRGVPYTSGGIISKELMGYGYYEIRAKLWADGHGLHQSFWNMGLNYASDHDYYLPFMNMINEIDMFEVDSDSPTRLIATAHYHNTPNGRHVKPQGSESIVTIDDPSAGYRVYGFEWLPDQVIWYVDGEVIKTYNYQGPHAMQNLWITALQLSHDALEVDESVLPGYMYVDYFRYYQKRQPDLLQAHIKSVLIDNEDADYEEVAGAWSEANVPFGYQDRSTRQSNALGAEALWRMNVDAGSYEVFVWNPSYFDSTDASVQYTVHHNGTVSTVLVDQTTAGQNWVSLGVYEMAGDAQEAVSIKKITDNASFIRTDSVMLVPVSALLNSNASNGYQEAAGSWSSSTAVKGWDDSSTRFSSDANAVAKWEPQLDAGAYDILVWLPVHANNSPKYKYTVQANGQSNDYYVNGREGRSRWVNLGTFELGGTNDAVLMSNALNYGVIRSDAIKFYPSEPADAVAPQQPAGLTYQAMSDQDTGNYKLQLDWLDHAEADVAGYHIYMNGYRINQTILTSSYYRLERLLPQHTFNIGISAVDHAGNESVPAELSVTTGSGTVAPAIPTADITVTQARSGSLLVEIGTLGEFWRVANTEYDFQGYYYYVDGVRHNTIPAGRSYTITGLTNANTYSITVTAVDWEGNESAPTEPVNAAPLEQHIMAYATNMAGYSREGTWIKWWQRGQFGRAAVTQEYGPSTYFQWLPGDALAAKSYEVWVWNARNIEATTAAKYTITNGTDTSVVLRSQYGKSTDSGWEYLGVYRFSGTEADMIRVEKDAADPSATTYLLTNAVKLIPIDTITVDGGQSGYSELGQWQNSSLLGHDGTNTRYAGPGASGSYAALWRPTITAAREYDVYLYKVVEANSDPNAKVDIYYNGGSESLYIDHTSGDSGWVFLGRYPFAAGVDGYVQNTLNTDWKVARADAVQFVPVERPIIIDNGDVGYSEHGIWQNSGLTGYNGTGTRYSATNLSGNHYATWQPEIGAAGSYTVSIYKVVNNSSDPNAKIEIVHSGGTDTVYLDYSTGSSGWIELGTYSFDLGSEGYVRLYLNTDWRSARADAVKWVPAI